MMGRRKFLGMPAAVLLAPIVQPDEPSTSVTELVAALAAPTRELSDSEFRLYASLLFDILLQSNFNLWEEVRRLQWLSPGPDLYTNEEGDT
jgi:hypothetical protein